MCFPSQSRPLYLFQWYSWLKYSDELLRCGNPRGEKIEGENWGWVSFGGGYQVSNVARAHVTMA